MAADDDTDEARAARGDRQAFSRLMAATSGDLHRFVRRYVGDADEAHDLLQEAYVSAWLAIRRYDPTRPFATWLRSIAVNKCRDWGRKRAVRRIVRGVMGLDTPEAMAVGEDAPEAESTKDAPAGIRHPLSFSFTLTHSLLYTNLSRSSVRKQQQTQPPPPLLRSTIPLNRKFARQGGTRRVLASIFLPRWGGRQKKKKKPNFL